MVDIDSHNFPNLVLMKLSAWHKAKGDEVELLKPADVLNGMNLFGEYDKLYGACVFDWNKNICEMLEQCGVEIGGCGSTHKEKVLTHEQEHIFPDYSLYGIKDKSFGFLTRGCPRHCPFCIVGDKEGLISRKVADLSEFWNGQKEICLCDPNMFACKDWQSLAQQLIDSNALIDFNQGVDIRIMTKEKVDALNSMNLSMVHFAWDNYPDEHCYNQLKKYRDRFKLDGRHLTVYVLTNYNTTIEQDLDRLYKLRSLDYTPYVMIFDKQHAPKEIRRMQRWCNNRFIWRSCEKFEDYKG